jgi:hypothetical protein
VTPGEPYEAPGIESCLLPRRAALVSLRSAISRRCSHLSIGSTSAARSRRACAWRSFCRLVPRAWAMSSHEAPERRAASIQKISACSAHHTACRTLCSALRGRCGPLEANRRALAALAAHWRANVPSMVLTAVSGLDSWTATGVVKKRHSMRPEVGLSDLCLGFHRRGNPTAVVRHGSMRSTALAAISEKSVPALRKQPGTWTASRTR